jgi:hypothetical protein
LNQLFINQNKGSGVVKHTWRAIVSACIQMSHPSQKSQQLFDGWHDWRVFFKFTVWQFVQLVGLAGWHARQNNPKAHFSKINNKKHTIATVNMPTLPSKGPLWRHWDEHHYHR